MRQQMVVQSFMLQMLLVGVSLMSQAQANDSRYFPEETGNFLSDLTKIKNQGERSFGRNIRVVSEVYRYQNSSRNRLKAAFDYFKEWDVPKVYKERFQNTTYAKVDSITFSSKEQDSILKFFSKTKRLLWPDSMLSDASFFTLHKQNYWQYYDTGFFQLSRPLFLRNNMVAIFFWRLIKDFSGYETLSVYVKKNAGWEEFAVIYNGEGALLP